MSGLSPSGAWTLCRFEIRSPAAADAYPVARVELLHSSRGRVSDIASAPGPLAAVCEAVQQIIGQPARTIGIELSAEPLDDPSSSAGPVYSSRVSVEANGRAVMKQGRSTDPLTACVDAYVAAIGELARLGEADGKRRAEAVIKDFIIMNRGCCA